MIQGDSVEYDLLAKWANFDCKGDYSCEIGVRDGMGSKIIMDNIKNNFICILVLILMVIEFTNTSTIKRIVNGTV
jgi:hypothetical protein